MNPRNTEILKFLMVGGITFFIDYGLLFCLTEYVHFTYMCSSAVSFAVAVGLNYVLSLLFVFRKANNGWKQIVLFVVTSIIGLGLNQLCMLVFVEKLEMYYMMAKIGATVIVTSWNYITKKKALEL